MANPIVTSNVTQTVASTPNTLQKKGALVSTGGTALAQYATSFLTQASDLAAILTAPLAVTSLTWSGGVATVTTTATHGITSGDTFLTIIAGAVPSVYNGTFLATSTGASTFTYSLASDGGTSPATGTITFTERNVAELVAEVASFFGQGSQQGVYVLELGAAEPAASVANMTTYLTANPNAFYGYLVPSNWDSIASFLTLIASYEATTSKTYFFVSSTTGTYSSYTALMKCVFWLVPAPLALVTESDIAMAFQIWLNYAPSSTNKVTPFEYSYVTGATPWPSAGNNSTLTAIKAAGGNYIGTGAEGGISNTLIIGGQYADKNPVNYWYAVDWAQINGDLAISAAVINGSNNPSNPLYYNQDGINRLQQALATVFNNGVSYGIILFNVKQTQLDVQPFNVAINNDSLAGFTVVNAIPFILYSGENTGDYKIGRYAGFAAQFTPLRGFDSIVINFNVTNFVSA